MRLIYSDRALSDLEGIMDHIGGDKPEAAVRMGEGILRTAKVLEENPHLGVACEDIATGLRRFTYHGYSLYYRVDAANMIVSLERILHPSRDVSQQSFD